MMQAIQYNLQQGKGVIEISQIHPNWKSLDKLQQQQEEEELQVIFGNNYNCISKSSKTELTRSGKNNNSSRTTSSVDSEPTSTLTTSGGDRISRSDNILAGVADPECGLELHHRVPTGSGNVSGCGGGGVGSGIGLEEWDSLFPNGDGSLLPWITGDPDDSGLGLKNLLQSGNPSGLGEFEGTNRSFEGLISPNCGNTPAIGFDLNPGQFIGGSVKPQILSSQFVVNQQQVLSGVNPSFVMSSDGSLGEYCQQFEQLQPRVKRHNPGVVFDTRKNTFVDPGLNQVPMMLPQVQMQEQGVKDQLFKVGELIQTGNFSLAQEILARLNHQLSFPAKPPLVRAALYVKEALQMLLQLSNPVAAPPARTLTPYDVVHKMDAYKVFSEVSPITQFVNFTCTQAVLEALDDSPAVHIVDFDIGCGAQWASLIQELPLRKMGAPSLRITAVVPPTTHSFELALIRENLVQFANDTGIAFEFQVLNFDSFNPSSSSLPSFRTSEDECIAVSIPIWSSSSRPSSLSSILQFIKERSPKIVVSLDKGFDRYDVPFPQHLIHSLESTTNILESLDGLNVASDIISKVEKFFIQPRIENSVLGRLHAPNKMPHWKNLFASAGLMPLQFSNFTETQADYVVKRTPGTGFHVEKRQAALVLSWQRRELVSASAWRYS